MAEQVKIHVFSGLATLWGLHRRGHEEYRLVGYGAVETGV
jgi:hypothetical protein